MKYIAWMGIPVILLYFAVQTVVQSPFADGPAEHLPAVITIAESVTPPESAKPTIEPVTEPVLEDTSDLPAAPVLPVETTESTSDSSDTAQFEAKPEKSTIISGTVTRIIDGDTVMVNDGIEDIKIRFAAIDAPESSQPGGKDAFNYLYNLIYDKQVQVFVCDTDRYGRVIGQVALDETDVNQQMVHDGFAWFYKEYASGLDYSVDQEYAAKHKLGIWKKTGNVPPWLYRKLNGVGTFGQNVMSKGLYLDKNGILHNNRCQYRYPESYRWNGVDSYKNCPICGGAIFD